MYARRKVRYLREPSPNAGLEEEVRRVAHTESAADKMSKDLLLIDAALRADRVILSLDDEARNLFGGASATIPLLKTITWVNPSQSTEGATDWLAAGAEPEEQRRLGTR